MTRLLRAIGALAAMIFLRRRRQARDAATPAEKGERQVGSSARAERWALALLLCSTLAALAFIVVYAVSANTQLLGLTLGLAFAAAEGAVGVAGKSIVPQEQGVEEYQDYGDIDDQKGFEAGLRGADEGISRRRLLIGGAGAAGATLGAALLAPLASFGPRVGDELFATPWRAGRRVVDSEDRPILAADVEDGTFWTGFPEGADKSDMGSSIVIVRLPEGQIEMSGDRRAGAPQGIVAYSKICTHAGCAISLYRHPLFEPDEPKPALVCPCHYSTFDPARAGAVEYGPAGRPLPQLPLRVNDAGELEAGGGFFSPVGPSWLGVRERGETSS